MARSSVGESLFEIGVADLQAELRHAAIVTTTQLQVTKLEGLHVQRLPDDDRVPEALKSRAGRLAHHVYGGALGLARGRALERQQAVEERLEQVGGRGSLEMHFGLLALGLGAVRAPRLRDRHAHSVRC